MWKKILFAGSLLGLLIYALYSGWTEAISLENLKENRARLLAFVESDLAFAATSFFGIYVVVTSLSLPGAAVLSLASGALFGFPLGVVLVSVASTIGASVAFLLSRWLFREWVEKRFDRLAREVNHGFDREGTAYLLTLRLLPAIPFFAVNLLMGLTRIPLWKFFVVSWAGMFPATLVYVNAGTRLSDLNSLGDILTVEVILSFSLLAVFPLAAKRSVEFWRRKRRA